MNYSSTWRNSTYSLTSVNTLCKLQMGKWAARKCKVDIIFIVVIIPINGVAFWLTHRFSRSLKGDSIDQDLDLNSSYYILYGTGDTPQGDIAYPMTLLHGATCINIFTIFTASKSGGFTYHQKTPAISTTLINPAQNSSSLSLESAMVASAGTCPTFPVCSFCPWCTAHVYIY